MFFVGKAMLFQQDLVENAVPLIVFEAAAVKQELASSRPRLGRGYLKVSTLQVYCQCYANDVVTTSCVLLLQSSDAQAGRLRDRNRPALAGHYIDPG